LIGLQQIKERESKNAKRERERTQRGGERDAARCARRQAKNKLPCNDENKQMIARTHPLKIMIDSLAWSRLKRGRERERERTQREGERERICF
jgi:hypothetical protein